MVNVTTADAKTVTRDEDERCCYNAWLEDYFEQLEGKNAYREFQEHRPDTREQYYYALIASLMA